MLITIVKGQERGTAINEQCTIHIIRYFITGEIVIFVMLGFILLSLTNIHTTLKKIYLQNERNSEVKE